MAWLPSPRSGQQGDKLGVNYPTSLPIEIILDA
jgi:hypothetical protein